MIDHILFSPQAQEEKEEMESLREYNLKLLSNILPLHVAKYFLSMKSDTVSLSIMFYICFFPINILKRDN